MRMSYFDKMTRLAVMFLQNNTLFKVLWCVARAS